MPSYLFAIASGDIATASIGPRSLVSTGPEELSDAKWELEADTEKFIEVAEKLIYPYQWTQYNVLVLPPSFPYGGMENPVFTFATPTIISGDRENVDVIAHELSHSWSGNLVSNASWEHFWLNEGWTTYLERRIQAAVHGEPHRDFSAIIGWKALLAGFLAMSLTIPLNIFCSKRYAAAQDRLMKVRDTKMGVVTEALQGMSYLRLRNLADFC